MANNISRILGEDSTPTTTDLLRVYLRLFKAYLDAGFIGQVNIVHRALSDNPDDRRTFTDLESLESYVHQRELDEYSDVLSLDPADTVHGAIILYCPEFVDTENFDASLERFREASEPFVSQPGKSRLEAPLMGRPREFHDGMPYTFVHVNPTTYGLTGPGNGAVCLYSTRKDFYKAIDGDR